MIRDLRRQLTRVRRELRRQETHAATEEQVAHSRIGAAELIAQLEAGREPPSTSGEGERPAGILEFVVHSREECEALNAALEKARQRCTRK
jgi:hypothetical protein